MDTLMLSLAMIILIAVVALLIFVVTILRKLSSLSNSEPVNLRIGQAEEKIAQHLAMTSADMAERLEKAKGDLRQDTSDRLTHGLLDIKSAVEENLLAGRREQAERLDAKVSQIEVKFEALRAVTEDRLQNFSDRQALGSSEARKELTEALSQTTRRLEEKFEGLSVKNTENLELLRNKVDERLQIISEHVQKKLDENIKEGFSQFEKVQEHLKSAEERLKEVSEVGESIHDLNNLLKMPHLRGRFGEMTLERILADFLPSSMYDLQKTVSDNNRPDAMIHFPDRHLPIDSKFPREQVLPLFESNDPAELAAAREKLSSVIRTEARKICKYIKPEEGTTEMALMFLPSEILWFEVIHNTALSDELNRMRVYPVSPNTLCLALNTIAQAHKWYQVETGFRKTREELGKARKLFEHFMRNFDLVGKALGKAQDSYSTAATHLSSYRNRIVSLTGEPIAEIEDAQADENDIGMLE